MSKIASKSVSDSAVSIAFSDEPQTVLTVDLSELSPEIVTQLALHGLSQKLGDSYSGVKGKVEEAIALASKVAERLKNGEFNAKREGGTGGVTDLMRALAKVTGRELPEAKEAVDQMDKSAKLNLRKHPQIAVALAEIAAEKAREKAEQAEGQESGDLGSYFG